MTEEEYRQCEGMCSCGAKVTERAYA
jgi:hypothetical protein